MGKHDDGRRYLNHSYHVPWAHQKVQIDWMSIGNKTVNLVLAPTLKNTHRGKCDKTPDKQNIAEASLANGVSLLLKKLFGRLESWQIDEKMSDNAEPSQINHRWLLDVRLFLW